MKLGVTAAWTAPKIRFGLALLGASLASLVLFGYGALRNHSFDYNYLVTNLCLAWLPLVFAAWLSALLKRKLWSSWSALVASVLWLLFLPNSFYMVSDFIHLQEVQRVDVLYDAVMFAAFIFTAVALGLTSLFLVHREFAKRFSPVGSSLWLAAIFVLCGFAIYLGRDLRWNSWDVLTNPGGLLFDISDRLLHPSAYPSMLLTVFSFFIFLVGVYGITWTAAQLLRPAADHKQR